MLKVGLGVEGNGYPVGWTPPPLGKDLKSIPFAFELVWNGLGFCVVVGLTLEGRYCLDGVSCLAGKPKINIIYQWERPNSI